MSTTIERKVKKKPVVVHQPRKVINSKEKSLHRSVLSHSRIASGYKKKIAALLGNNRALAHALELAHIELTNRDKLAIELQRRLTLQSPKRFKAKLQKVCEHLHVIVALLQDVLDDCEDYESNMCSFNLQTSNYSMPDTINGEHENESPLETGQSTNDLASKNIEINTTPFPILQPPRLTTAAEMSAILEQSVLSADENLPPILFPEDESQVISNVTTRPRSKSRSASSRPRSRGSKIHLESPPTRNSTYATNLDNENNHCNNNEVYVTESTLSHPSPPSVSFKSFPSPKRKSSQKKFKHQENSPSSIVSESNCLNDSQKKSVSPEETSKSEKSVKRKSILKRKSKKKILVVKLACTPKRTLARENADNAIAKELPNAFTHKKSPDRRKTIVVNKNKKVRPSMLSPEETKGTVDALRETANSKLLKVHANKVLSSSEQLYNGHDGDSNCVENKGKSDSNNRTEAQHFNTAMRSDNTCIIPQDMDLTCQSLIKESNAVGNGAGDVNSSSMNSTKPLSNSPCSSLMFGYDPLEGTSKNRKSSILLKKPKSIKSKSSSKIPQIKNKPAYLNPNIKSPISKINGKIIRPSARTESISSDSDVLNKEPLRTSPTKSHSSLPLRYNSHDKNSQQEIFDLLDDCSHPAKSGQLEIKINSNLSSLTNHSPVNRLAKENTATTLTESNRDNKAFLNSVQPVVKLNDIWTSVKSPSLTSHSNNYVYISDSLAGGVLKVDTTPRKPLKLVNDSIMQNSKNEETGEARFNIPTDASKTVETVSEKVAAAKEMLNSYGFKKRRAPSVTYKEPSIRKKLRQGDPFTSDIQNVPILKKRPKRVIQKEVKKEYSESGKTRKVRSCSSKASYFEDTSSDVDD